MFHKKEIMIMQEEKQIEFPEGFPKFDVKKKYEKSFRSTKGNIWTVVYNRLNLNNDNEYDEKEFDDYYDKYGDAYDIYEADMHDINFYKNGEWKYMLKENDYRTEFRKSPFVEYFEMDDENNEPQVVHTLNDDHGCLSLYNAETGELIHKTNQTYMFFEEYKMFPGDIDDREYMYIGGWVWTPFAAKMIIHIPTFLKTPKYNPIQISCCEEYEKNERRGKISLHGCTTVTELLQKKR